MGLNCHKTNFFTILSKKKKRGEKKREGGQQPIMGKFRHNHPGKTGREEANHPRENETGNWGPRQKFFLAIVNGQTREKRE